MIKAKDLKKVYGKGSLKLVALNVADLEIKDGEFVSIIGASGAGKSTLLYQLSLLDDPTSGEVFFDEVAASGLSQTDKTRIRLERMGFVFQDYALLPELTAAENVALPIIMQGASKRKALKKAKIALERMGIADKEKSLPSQLSGGQQQRVSISRAIAHDPKVLFADEPTANLDSENSLLVLGALTGLHKEGQTIVMVTHEEEYARKALRTISLKDGFVVRDEKNSL